MTFSPLLFLMATSSSTTTSSRQFQFVDYGQSYSSPDGRPTISCDGRIPGGVTLELTHWTGNETPDELYADTSTEMALKFAQHEQYAADFVDAIVLNNHYDTDGILSVWACLEPTEALKYSALLIHGAEAGDFGEWSSDMGVKLDCALSRMCAGDQRTDFEKALQEMPKMLNDFQETGGKFYEKFWKPGFDDAIDSWSAFEKGDAVVEAFNDDIALVKEPALPESLSFPLSPYAIHRALVQKGLQHKTKRVLKASSKDDMHYMFKYDKIGHGWIQKVVERPVIPNVDSNKLVEDLNSLDNKSWKAGGDGLVAICHTQTSIPRSPEEVAETMAKYDTGLQTS